MAQKTNVARMLEKSGLAFEFIEYEVDESDLSGEHVAQTIAVPPEQVFKTLVLKGERIGYFVCCIPSQEKIDLKKAAKAVGEKSASLIPVKDLLPVTGYIRGGCSPIGMKKLLPTYIDETAMLFTTIIVSAGIRGGMVRIEPETLLTYINASYVDLTLL